MTLRPAQARALELLQRNKAFRPIKRAYIQDLVERGHEWHYSKGQPLMVQGGPSDKLFVILDGRVHVEHRSSDGGVLGVAELGVGDPIGEMGLLANEPRYNTVKALTDVDALEIDGSHVRQVFAHDPDLLQAFIDLVHQRVLSGPPRPWV